MSAQKYKEELFEAVQLLLWRQWVALGVPGQVLLKNSEMVLDPEALLIFSAHFARYDQRLYDLILEWLQVHSSQINVQRLKALFLKAKWRDPASLGYMAAVTAETDHLRWRNPAKEFAADNAVEPFALFLDREGQPEPFIPKQDPLALQYGFRRNVRQTSAKIPANLQHTPATLLLRMRGVLGISARAETLLMLLSSGPCKVQEIADRSGFTWKSIQDALGELAAGNWITVIDNKRRGKQYLLNDSEKFLHLFGVRKPAFAAWTLVYDAVGVLWQSCMNPALGDVSDETFHHELKTLYRETIQPKLLESGIPVLQKAEPDLLTFPKLLSTI